MYTHKSQAALGKGMFREIVYEQCEVTWLVWLCSNILRESKRLSSTDLWRGYALLRETYSYAHRLFSTALSKTHGLADRLFSTVGHLLGQPGRQCWSSSGRS